MTAALEIAPMVGVRPACEAFDVSRATVYRRRRPRALPARRKPGRALSEAELAQLLEVLCSERFVDASPAQVYATLLEEGEYLASVSTMYRLLRSQRAVRERRSVTRHPSYARPELVATAPNQVWTWDITKIRGPDRRTWFHLYVVIDIFSRYVVGWMLALSESASLAERFLAETLEKEGVLPGTLTLHSDRGPSMRSKTVAEFLADIGVTKSHSRPRTSNDNAFSEAQFKTTKYCPFFPGRFFSIAEAREYFRLFFRWYNQEHHHSGIAMLTPATVHHDQVEAVCEVRQKALDAAFAARPERFVHGAPRVARPPAEVWINRPGPEAVEPSGVAEPPPEASVRPSPAQRADREGEVKATEPRSRPDPRAAREREHGEDGEEATLPEPSPAVSSSGDGWMEADEHPRRQALGQRM